MPAARVGEGAELRGLHEAGEAPLVGVVGAGVSRRLRQRLEQRPRGREYVGNEVDEVARLVARAGFSTTSVTRSPSNFR